MANQQRLPGVVPKEISEIQDKAQEVKDLQEERMDVAQREQKAREELRDLMKAAKKSRLDLDDKFEIVIESSETKAFVRRKKGVKKDKTSSKGDGDAEKEVA